MTTIWLGSKAHRARLRAFAIGASLLLATLVAACGSDNDTVAATYPNDSMLRLNQIQVLGTHNSYHIQPKEPLFSWLMHFSSDLALSLQYSHPPLDEQFEHQGIRQIELDVYADPNGGLFANRSGLYFVHQDTASHIPDLDLPGFKVLHVQDLDFESTCWTFVECLQTVKSWSDAHPGHVPIMIQIEAEDEAIPIRDAAVPVPFDTAQFDALDAEIRSVFTPAQMITPDDVRGTHATLEEAVRTDGWPTLGQSRGRVLFMLDNEGGYRDAYLAGHPALAGRILFTSARPGNADAGFIKLNDPVCDFDLIQQVVAEGFVVRTRADADTVEARTGNTQPRDMALASGAQWVSTDYPVPDPSFGTGYFVSIPGGTPARCNPISAPARCSPLDIENPHALTTR
jgi:calcium-dependent phosphoinositide phospholipase C